MIVLHYTGMVSAAVSLNRLCDPDAKVSAHYLIEENGEVWQLVDEERRAWHAGVASWNGETDINALSIGVELQNPGHEHGYTPFPMTQIEALIALMDQIRSRHEIPDGRIVGHSDVAPQRKEDPGELFPWRTLATAGHGIWPEPEAAAHPVEDVTAAMLSIGYAIGASVGDTMTRASLLAFQRRYLPDHLTAEPDHETIRKIGQVYCLTVET